MSFDLSTYMAPVALCVFAGAMIWAAIGDVRSFIITNKLNLAIAGLFLVLALPAGLSLTNFGWHIGVGVLAFVVSIGLFAIGVYGGGDAKLTGAAALWLGPTAMMPFLLYTALSGGLLVVVLMIGRALAKRFGLPRGPKWARRMLRKQSAVPYGVALCVGALLAVPNAAWFPHSALQLAAN
jgi:prepilin peptidase CpaA